MRFASDGSWRVRLIMSLKQQISELKHTHIDLFVRGSSETELERKTQQTEETRTMMVDEQINSYWISFELTNQTTPIRFRWYMMLIINFLCQLGLDPELMKRVHMNVWHHWQTANHNTEQVCLTSRERASEIQNLFVKG